MTTQQKLEDLSPEQLQFLLDNLDNFSEAELRGLDKTTGATVEAKSRENCQENFMDFTHKVWPNFIDGEHHAKMAAAFEIDVCIIKMYFFITKAF
jgi:flagellar biosynthesis regulator FlaF